MRTKPSIVIVLTDGYTPWPERAPEGVRVVVGLLREEGGGPHVAAGLGAAVVIEDAARGPFGQR